MLIRYLGLVACLVAVFMVAGACGLNPQPEPPGGANGTDQGRPDCADSSVPIDADTEGHDSGRECFEDGGRDGDSPSNEGGTDVLEARDGEAQDGDADADEAQVEDGDTDGESSDADQDADSADSADAADSDSEEKD